MTDLGSILLAAAVGALLLLDNNVVLQGWFSRPLVTGALAGAVLTDGSPYPLLGGAMLELLYAHVIPIGEAHRPSATFLGVLTALVLALWPGGLAALPPLARLAALFIVVFCGIPLSYLALQAQFVVRRGAGRLTAAFERAIDAGDFHRLFWLNLLPVPAYWLAWFVLLLLFVPLLRVVTAVMSHGLAGTVWEPGLMFAALCFPLLGLAVIASLFDGLRRKGWLLGGFGAALGLRLLAPALSLGLFWLLLGLGILGFGWRRKREATL